MSQINADNDYFQDENLAYLPADHVRDLVYAFSYIYSH